jgi:hypothetical protein
MYALAYYRSPGSPSPHTIVDVVETVDEASSVFCRHNHRGAISHSLRQSLLRQKGIVVADTKFVVLDLNSDLMVRIAGGMASRPAYEVKMTGLDDKALVSIYNEARTWLRRRKILQIL